MKAIGHSPLLVKVILDTPTVSPIAFAETPVVIATVTQVTMGEYSYTHPTGSWGSFDDDDGVI